MTARGRFLLAFAVGSALCAVPARASVLSDAAASMAPGTWKSVSTSGTNIANVLGVYSGCPTEVARTILSEGPRLTWDPIHDRFYFYGSDHAHPGQFVQYDAATNRWSTLARAGWMQSSCGGSDHGEDQNAFDPVAGIFFRRAWGADTMSMYNTSTGVWTQGSAKPASTSDDMVGMDWFPERGTVVVMDPMGSNPNGIGALREYNVASNTWTSTSWSAFGGDCNASGSCFRQIVRYNPVHHFVVFTSTGYSDRRLFKLAQNGTITRYNNAPFDISSMLVSCPCSSGSAIMHPDPVTGDFIVIRQYPNDSATPELWKWNPVTDVWTQLPNSIPSALFSNFNGNRIFGVAATTIAEFGVIAYVTCDSNGTDCRMHLYKHAPSSPPTTPPVPGGFVPQ